MLIIVKYANLTLLSMITFLCHPIVYTIPKSILLHNFKSEQVTAKFVGFFLPTQKFY